MAAWTYADYMLANYGISSSLCVTVLIVLKLLPFPPYYFLIERVLGIQLPRKKPNPSMIVGDDENVEIDRITIEIYDITDYFYPHRLHRLGLYGLLSGILSLFAIIIFNSLFLWSTRVPSYTGCPSRIADYFIFTSFHSVAAQGTYNCTPGSVATIPYGALVICYAWIMREINFLEIINALGICGGLLSVVGSIMPFIHNLSLNECCYPYGSLVSGALVAATMAILIILFGILKMSTALVTYLVVILTGVLSMFASVWACRRIRKRRSTRKIKPASDVTIASSAPIPLVISGRQVKEPILVDIVSKRRLTMISSKIIPVSD